MDSNEGCFRLFQSNRREQYGNNDNHSLSTFVQPNSNNVAAAAAGEPTPSDIDSLIAQEMTSLSMQEREKAMNDVHGIPENKEEDPQLLQQSLDQLDYHLTTIQEGTAYAQAAAMSLDYVTCRNFRLMFLRADRYEPRKGAERMIQFFELKRTLFGSKKLVKEILLDDLDDDDMEALRSGGYQLSPYKDTAGRPILISLPKLRKYKKLENVLRSEYYILMSAIQNPQAQIHGMVGVYYLLDSDHIKSLSGKLRKSLPIHMASLHVCSTDMQAFAMACMGVYTLAPTSRVRYRPHFGSHVECQYALTTFGIPRNGLPISSSGEMHVNKHLNWIERRQELESKQKQQSITVQQPPEPYNYSASSPILPFSNGALSNGNHYTDTTTLPVTFVAPCPSDVLFGRGRGLSEHPGNIRFRNVVDLYMNQYLASTRIEKTCIAEIIVEMVKDSSGRFLKKENNGDRWEEVDYATARKKVAHAFRNRRKLHGFS